MCTLSSSWFNQLANERAPKRPTCRPGWEALARVEVVVVGRYGGYWGLRDHLDPVRYTRTGMGAFVQPCACYYTDNKPQAIAHWLGVAMRSP